MSFLNPWKPAERIRCGDPAWDGQAFELDDARVPDSIRVAVRALYRPGDTLYFADTEPGGEWWLMDGEKLIEAFWLE